MTELQKLNKTTPRRNASKIKNSKSKMNDEQTKRFGVYQKKYIRLTYRQFSMRFRSDTDADVIEFLDNADNVPNLTNFVRRAALAEIYKDDPREKDLNGRPFEIIAEYEKVKHENALLTKQQIGRGL